MRFITFLLLGALSGCAGLLEEPGILPELNYSAMTCEQLSIELALEIDQLSLSQRLLVFERAIPNGRPWEQERAVAQARVNIDAIARQAPRCESSQ